MFSSFNGVRRFTPPVSGLFPFVSHVFTNCAVTGRIGPTLAQIQAAYSGIAWAQDTAFLNQGAYQGYQKWTVPETGEYLITAVGATGGSRSPGGYPGRGASAQATVMLQKGEFLIIIVGQMGTTASSYGGGGGGSFVVRLTNNVPLVIAGGGGGAQLTSDRRVAYADASITSDARSYYQYPDNRGVQGAGGFSGNGMNSLYNGAGALGYPSGLVGCQNNQAAAGAGGFGGGSCGEAAYWGSSGHGGGFSGGCLYQGYGTGGAGGSCSAFQGCGGGSYATGSNLTITGAVGIGHGSVTISR